MHNLVIAAMATAIFLPPTANSAPLIRESGAIYLSDFGEKPIKLTLNRAANAYFDVGMTRFAGTLRFPQTVQAEAFSESGLRIRGNARQGGIAGWIPFSDVEGLPEGFMENLRKAEERRLAVEALIAENEVALGMTAEEVHRSLGKPQKKTRSTSKEAASQIWEYIQYELVPQTVVGPGFSQTVVTIPGATNRPPKTIVTGSSGLTSSTVYVKVPVGKMTIKFSDDIVESIEESEQENPRGQVSVVVPPINVY